MSRFNKIYLGNCYMYEFCIEDLSFVDGVIEKINKLELKKNFTNYSTATHQFFDTNMFSWFNSCIDIAKTDLGFPADVNLPITICWANKSTKLQNHHTHSHNNSFMSGIFYLTDGGAGGKTIFYFDNPWFNKHQWIDFDGVKKEQTYSYTPKKGSLLLFPSDLKHGVSTVKENVTRYTVAFNTFLSGKFGDATSKTYLELFTPSIKGNNEA